jgi:hypothetical protein
MPDLSPSLSAGLLLAALPLLKRLGLPAPTGTAILELTGAGRTTAYKVKAAVEEHLPQVLRPTGRPPAPPAPEGPPTPLAELHRAVVTFLFDNPGAVSGGPSRRVYTEAFRCFALDRWEEHRELGPAALAEALCVPLPTLKDWLQGERPQVAPPETLATARSPAPAQLQTVLDAWERWADKRRGFTAFCKHVWFHLRIPLSMNAVRDLLQAHGVRIPNRRGRPPDAAVGRGGFETFFPRAQWVGDGTELAVTINGQRFVVNLELLVDADSGAFVGASIRQTEDAKAVTDALSDGQQTTRDTPLALLLDNKPSNHGQEVDEALGDETLRLRSRPYVPTDKPHVEGAFGLFSQEVPDLVVRADDPETLAQQIAFLVVTTWARTVNHRPRADRDGKSRAQLYRAADPTDEEIAQAREALLERQRKQQKARQTRARRLDPIVRQRLDEAFERLGLDDPDHDLREAIACWPLEAVVNAIAIFEGKRAAGTLPKGADGRYLRGIVKNMAEEAEGWQIAQALLRERLAARDQALEHLKRQHDAIEDEAPDAPDLIKAFVDKALKSQRGIDRTFWLLATADVILDGPPEDHSHLLRLAARRIHATSSVPHDQRLASVRFLYAKVVPID